MLQNPSGFVLWIVQDTSSKKKTNPTYQHLMLALVIVKIV